METFGYQRMEPLAIEDGSLWLWSPWLGHKAGNLSFYTLAEMSENDRRRRLT